MLMQLRSLLLNNFQVLSPDRTQEVGKICKQWGGVAKEYLTDADNFGIQCMHTYVSVCLCVHSSVLHLVWGEGFFSSPSKIVAHCS